MQADIYFKRFNCSDLSDDQLSELKKFDKYLTDGGRRYYRVDAYTLHLMCIACSLNQATRKDLFEAWTEALIENVEYNSELEQLRSQLWSQS